MLPTAGPVAPWELTLSQHFSQDGSQLPQFSPPHRSKDGDVSKCSKAFWVMIILGKLMRGRSAVNWGCDVAIWGGMWSEFELRR